MLLADRANKYIEENAPWALAKDPAKAANLASVMAHLARVLFVVGTLLSPILVHKSVGIYDQLGLPEEKRVYDNVLNKGVMNGCKVNKGDPLFPRLNVEDEVKAIAEMMAAPKEKAAA